MIVSSEQLDKRLRMINKTASLIFVIMYVFFYEPTKIVIFSKSCWPLLV